MLNVHPSLLPRWRGAAPIERAIMAGDRETGVCDHAGHGRARLRAGRAAARRVEIGAGEDFGSLSARLAELGGELIVRALDLRAAGALELDRAGRLRGHLRREDRPERAPPRPVPAGARAAADGAGAEPAHRRLPGARRRRAARRSRRARRAPTASWSRASSRATGELLARLRARARCGSSVVQPPGGRPMPADAYLRGHSLPSLRRADAARERRAAPRRAAYEVLRRVFEHEAWADRAFPAAADRHGLDRRERAQAQRLAYGAVQRRGTSDHLIASLAERPLEQLDPPVLAALRLGLYELLFSDATPTTPPSTRRSSWPRGRAAGAASAAAGLVNAVLRRAAASATSCSPALRRLDPARAPRSPTRSRVAGARCGGRSWASARHARCWPPSTSPPRPRCGSTRCRPSPRRCSARAARAGASSAQRPGLLAPARGDRGRGAARRDGLGAPDRPRASSSRRRARSPGGRRGARPAAGRAGARPLRRPRGSRPTAIAARMARPRGGGRGRAGPAAGRPSSATSAPGSGATSVTVIEADARELDLGGGYDRVLVDPPCSDLGTLASRPDARWRKSPELIERLAAIQDAIARPRPSRRCGPAGTLVYSTCTISRRESEDRVAPLAARRRGCEADDLGASAPELASTRDAPFPADAARPRPHRRLLHRRASRVEP